MQLKKYPYKNNIKKVIEKYIALRDTQDFLKSRGILVGATRREDIANIIKDYYLSQVDFEEVKRLLDSPSNFKKMGRYVLASDKVETLKETLEGINGRTIDSSDNTRVTVEIYDDNNMNVHIRYEEQRPGLIELLETTPKSIEINIENTGEICNVNYNLNSVSDYKKVKNFLGFIQDDAGTDFSFKELQLSDLETLKRTDLFNQFFQYVFDDWEVTKITEINVKKDPNFTPVICEEVEETIPEGSGENIEEIILEGINSALLSGENLIDNSFVNRVLTQGFYFSMSNIRFENKETEEFFDFVIDFKSRPERLETRIVESGEYITNEQGETVEEKRIFSSAIQNEILNKFNDILYHIFGTLVNLPTVSIQVDNAPSPLSREA